MLDLLSIASNACKNLEVLFCCCLWKSKKNGLLLLASITVEIMELLTFHLVMCVVLVCFLVFLRFVFIGKYFSCNITFEEHCS